MSLERKSNESRFARSLFVLWPFIAFTLPAIVIAFTLPAIVCWGIGDLEQHFLATASVFVIPVAGLLELIPYFVVRSRGWQLVPGSMLPLVALNWWSWITVAAAIPGKVTGGGLDSILEMLAFDTMSRSWNEQILKAALIVGCASWIALLIAAACSRRVSAPSRRQVAAGVAVMLLAPCLVVVAALLGGVVETNTTDAEGELPAIALARPLDEQLNLVAHREDAAQMALSDVRKIIATDGWADVSPWMFRSCDSEANPCYVVYASAKTFEANDGALARTALLDQVRELGWQMGKRSPYCQGADVESFRKDNGMQLCLTYAKDALTVAVISPQYWGDLFVLRDAANPDALIFEPDGREPDERYRWDEWPLSDLRGR